MALSRRPSNHALQLAFDSTIRVNNGSGVIINNKGTPVIISAAHVVGKAPRALLRWSGGTAHGDVLISDDESDISVISYGGELPTGGVHLLDDSKTISLGDALWVSGFPGGWEDTYPVISSAELAGVGRKTWIRTDCIWGNSGSPIIHIEHDLAYLAGIVLGNIGEAERLLHVAIEEIKLRGTEAANPMAQGVFGLIKIVLDMVKTHFRTGFIEMATYEDIRLHL